MTTEDSSLSIKADFLFSNPQDERVDFDEKELVELKPYGLSLTNDQSRPFLILKDESGQYILPVGITQIEAGVALTQSSTNQVPATPHKFTEMLLKGLDIQLERCLFTEIKGLHQYVRVYMSGHPRYTSLKLKAEEAMSLCLHLKVPIFATKSYIARSKQMNAEVAAKSQKLMYHPALMGKNTVCH